MIEFREDTHEYFLDGRKLISVTQLMRKHGLAPSYEGVPSEVLRAKAERGTLIHKEIEQYIKTGEVGFTEELEAFIEHIQKHDITLIASECIVHNDLVSGTVDLFSLDDGEFTVNDYKTTATLHKEAVSWQLSIYSTLHGLATGNWASKGKAYHFKDGALMVVDIRLKPASEVLRLLECERKGEIYTQSLETVQEAQLAELAEVEILIKSIEDQKEKAEEQAKQLRQALMQAMEQSGVASFENERIKLTYVAPYVKSSVDSAKLKKELPEIAEKYTKTSNVKASLRITLKEDK